MPRSLTRVVASVVAALLGVAALTAMDVTAAVAAPVSDSNSLATITVDAHTRPGSTAVSLSGSLVPLTASGDCAANPGYLGWKVGSTSGGFTTAGAGDVRRFTSDIPVPGPGPFTVTVRAQGGCTGPDGLYPNLELTLTVDPAALVTYGASSIAGVAYLGDSPAADPTSYAPAADVVVDLLDVVLGVDGDPVATATTADDGSYWLPAPVQSQADADRDYRVRFSYGDPISAVLYHDGGTVTAWQSSTAEWMSAAQIGGPSGWAFSARSYDAILSRSTAPSTTNTARLCNDSESESIDVYETSAVLWDGVCETDPTFFGADHRDGGMTAAFARFGTVWFDQAAGPYRVTADRFATEDVDGVLRMTLHDDDIHLADQGVTVDVQITRTFRGADTRWVVEVRDATTGELADVPFNFAGAFQNDIRTTWTRSAAVDATWISDGNARRASDVREAAVAHHAVADAIMPHTDFENIQLEVRGGRLEYTLAVLGYTGCVAGSVRAEGLAIAEGLSARFGEDRGVLTGDPCEVTWPAPRVDPMTVGIPFDQTFTVDSTDLDWSRGGDAWVVDLPDGLQFESLDAVRNGIAPRLRIFGTPTTAGPYDMTAFAMNGVFRQDSVHLVGVVQRPPQTARITLNFLIGDGVAGATADVDGTGLMPGSAYEVVVESSPRTVGSGTIGSDFLLDDTVTMPTGLETGWHSISLSGTFDDGTPVAERLWFRVAADGALADIAATEPPDTPGGATDPALASTGVDARNGFAVAVLLLLGGIVALRRRERASEM